MDTSQLEARIALLEERVRLLESAGIASAGQTLAGPGRASGSDQNAVPSDSPQVPSPRDVVSLEMRAKRFDPKDPSIRRYSDNIWMDFSLTLSPELPPTRAVKGRVVFCDLFGEPMFLLGYTVTDPLTPGVPFDVTGVGFEFNEFKDAHKWVLGQAPDNMHVFFEVSQVIFADGRTASYGDE